MSESGDEFTGDPMSAFDDGDDSSAPRSRPASMTADALLHTTSAVAFGESSDFVADPSDIELVSKNSKKSTAGVPDDDFMPAPGSRIKSEPLGDRKVDYVVAWSKNEKEDAREMASAMRQRFLETCQDKGVILEYDTDQDDAVFVKMHVTFRRLCIAAQQNHFRMPLKPPEQAKNFGTHQKKESHKCVKALATCCTPSVDLTEDEGVFWAPFSVAQRHRFLNVEDTLNFFSTSQRSLLTYYILNHIPWGEASQVGIPSLLQANGFTACYPPHDGPADTSYGVRLYDNDRLTLATTWAKFSKMFKYQPFELIRDYFGEKIGFYFVWLGFYTRWLIPAAIAGFIVFIYGVSIFSDYVPAEEVCSSNYTICAPCDSCLKFNLSETCNAYKIAALFDNAMTIPFAIFMSLWATFFHEFWKRQSSVVAFEWDTRGIEEEEKPRPQFQPTDRRVSPITGEMEDYYPKKKFLLRVATSMSVLIMMLMVVIIVVIAVIIYRLAIRVLLYEADPDGLVGQNSPIITSITAAIINLVFILILNIVYRKMAFKLNDWENHRTETEWEDNLIFKVYLFQFVNTYASIAYIAFFKGKFIGSPNQWDNILGVRLSQCPPQGCMTELAIQLAIVMVGKQVIGNIVEMVIPALKKCCKKRDLGVADANDAGQYERDYGLLEFSGLFGEYLEMILQLGFITLFVAAFPLAPLFALLNNLFEIRLDAKKLIFQERRPPALRAEDVGTWEHIIAALGVMAVITNAFIIGFTSEVIDRILYEDKYGSLNGYIEHQFAFSPLDCATQPTTRNCDCYYKGYRDSAGNYSSYHYELLAARLGFIVVFEHVIFLLKAFVAFLVPDVPSSVQRAILREEYMGDLALGVTYDSDAEDIEDF